MARIQFSNRVGQAGIYHTGSPNYVDVDSGYTVSAGAVSFDARAVADSWDDGAEMGILLWVSATKYKVWWAYWDEANQYMKATTEEETVGSWADADEVTVTALVTQKMMEEAIWMPQIVTISGTTHTTLDVNFGATHICTNGSATTITLGDACRVGWHGLFLCSGAGLVSFARASTDTINGGTGNVDTAGQYKTAYVIQPTEGAWIAAV